MTVTKTYKRHFLSLFGLDEKSVELNKLNSSSVELTSSDVKFHATDDDFQTALLQKSREKGIVVIGDDGFTFVNKLSFNLYSDKEVGVSKLNKRIKRLVRPTLISAEINPDDFVIVDDKGGSDGLIGQLMETEDLPAGSYSATILLNGLYFKGHIDVLRNATENVVYSSSYTGLRVDNLNWLQLDPVRVKGGLQTIFFDLQSASSFRAAGIELPKPTIPDINPRNAETLVGMMWANKKDPDFLTNYMLSSIYRDQKSKLGRKPGYFVKGYVYYARPLVKGRQWAVRGLVIDRKNGYIYFGREDFESWKKKLGGFDFDDRILEVNGWFFRQPNKWDEIVRLMPVKPVWAKEEMAEIKIASPTQRISYSVRDAYSSLAEIMAGKKELGSTVNPLMAVQATGRQVGGLNLEAVIDAATQGDINPEAGETVDKIWEAIEDIVTSGKKLPKLFESRFKNVSKFNPRYEVISAMEFGQTSFDDHFDMVSRFYEDYFAKKLGIHDKNGNLVVKGEVHSSTIIPTELLLKLKEAKVGRKANLYALWGESLFKIREKGLPIESEKAEISRLKKEIISLFEQLSETEQVDEIIVAAQRIYDPNVGRSVVYDAFLHIWGVDEKGWFTGPASVWYNILAKWGFVEPAANRRLGPIDMIRHLFGDKSVLEPKFEIKQKYHIKVWLPLVEGGFSFDEAKKYVGDLVTVENASKKALIGNHIVNLGNSNVADGDYKVVDIFGIKPRKDGVKVDDHGYLISGVILVVEDF